MMRNTRQPTPALRAYSAHGGAAAMWACRDAEILLEGPAGTGKTRAALEKAHFCLLKYPRARILAVRKTRVSMSESVLVTYEEKVLPAGSPIKNGQKRSHRQTYDYPNGSTLVLGGMDNADRIMSTEFDMIVGFEWTEADEDDHEKLSTRLRNGIMPYQQLIVDCNPSYPNHWLNQRARTGKMTRIVSRHADNPTVSPAYLATLDQLSGARKERLLHGKWAAQDGLVYPEFDAAIHVIDRCELPAAWHRFACIDFGYTNPFVCQWWAVDPDGRLYLYREIYMSHRTLAEHIPLIRYWSQHDGIRGILADPEDAQGRAELAAAGLPTVAAIKAVSVGIQSVKEYLSVLGDGKPRLYLMRDSVLERDPALVAKKKPLCTLDEIDNYRWGIAAMGKHEKEEPIKEDDHGMDALRYAVRFAALNTAAPPDTVFYTAVGGQRSLTGVSA